MYIFLFLLYNYTGQKLDYYIIDHKCFEEIMIDIFYFLCVQTI